ncbi:ABC-F family ATP-binding cassette domain-containing protein [Streptomyces sp. ACA25]|uniref:ribosomal protection-like ABC-F family protein n=1 Tax=Streptomyces sp. ACA25 TaxID=3022596 RepID=UPI002307CD2B|nr:ABC-F family ATP-binding cassette domain-containing protein [Streptomyces sp. ACA25]MDB1086225.1 ABC-F family ATP-binding cassette domain-containing protein [Streptomyces sp. ACA25]
MPAQLTARAVTKAYHGHLVLDHVSFSVTPGERTGVIGENGSGKSTLLRLLAGREQPDHGRVAVTADGGIGYLPQDAALPAGLTVRGVIDRALHELRALEERMRQLEAAMADGEESGLDTYGELLTAFELRGGYDADARAERALHGLGLGRLPADRTVGSLSGGEAARLRLAALLTAAPEVLLLDEPTNHLDDRALGWLEDHLRTHRGTTVAVSHDRDFLDHFATALLEVDADRRTVTRHGNGYSGYLAETAADRRRRQRAHQQWCADIAALREAAAVTARRVAPGRAMKDGNKLAYDRAGGRVQQSLAGRVRNAEERLRRKLADPTPAPSEPLRFRYAPHPVHPLRGTVLAAADLRVPGRLAPTALTVEAGDRVLLTGPNGSGKSTLLHVLAGRPLPHRGRLFRRGRIGHLPQDPPPAHPAHTVREAFAHGRPGSPEEHEARLHALGLFTRDQTVRPVRSLSTGQRQRLALARLLSDPADILLLDEPTNHLSLLLVEELEAALTAFPGTVVLVSHDRRLRRHWPGTVRTLEA